MTNLLVLCLNISLCCTLITVLAATSSFTTRTSMFSRVELEEEALQSTKPVDEETDIINESCEKWLSFPMSNYHKGDEKPNSKKSHETRYVAECRMPTTFGEFRMRSYKYRSTAQLLEPIVMVAGNIENKENVIVRVHDQCFTSEVLGSLRCDCREQLHESLRIISRSGGVLIYLQQEGRGIGLSNKIAAYSLQDHGLDTVDANLHLGFKDELREYNVVPDILNDLKVLSIRLLTNNPFKINALKKLGVRITSRLSLQVPSNEHNERYLKSKRDRMHHMIDYPFTTQQSSTPVKFRSGEADKLPFTGGATLVAESSAGSSDSDEISKRDESVKPLSHHYVFGKASVEKALESIKEGRIVVVVDDENRENEGDLIMAAEKATPETIGFFVRYTSGVLCVSLESSRLDELLLPPMVTDNEDPKKTAYTISVDYKHGATTGISAGERARTFRALADKRSKPEDFYRPGHVFPLRYRPGGVLSRAGHTEASLDLSRLAGLSPAGVLAEVVDDQGEPLRLEGLRAFAQTHGLVLTSVQDLIAYRLELERFQPRE